MNEEAKNELAKEIDALIKLGREETEKVHSARKELAELELSKQAFLAQRQQEESLLLAETHKELDNVKLQIKLRNEWRDNKEVEFKVKEERLEQERQTLAGLQKEAEKERESQLTERVGIRRRSEQAEALAKKANDAIDKAEHRLKWVRGQEAQFGLQKDRIKKSEEDLKERSIKVVQKIEEASRQEKRLKIKNEVADDKLKLAQSKMDEAKKLVVWHEQSKKL